jgi:prephenate dehydratase
MTQQPISAAYQGEAGAWGEKAILDFFGAAARPAPCVTFDQVFESVASGATRYGCVPLENSLGGSIHRNYDLLMRHSLRIVGEVIVRVRWCLIALPGVALDNISRVSSHWQALAQTEQTLNTLIPNVERVEAYDTAGSVRLLKESGRRDTAALASRHAAALYEMPVLRDGLEDDPNNYTRFVILAREGDTEISPHASEHAHCKTSLVFAMKNAPGALFRSMAAFSLRDIDLSKIESRPLQGSPWEYLFYVDIVGHAEEERCLRALDHLREFATIMRVLGSYRRAEMPG